MFSRIRWSSLALLCVTITAIGFVADQAIRAADRALAAPNTDDPFAGDPSAAPKAERPAQEAKPAPKTGAKVEAEFGGEAHRHGGEAAIKKALAEPTKIKCSELPLTELVERLRDLHKIEIQIDKKALDEVAINHETPITRDVQGISLRSALRLMLRELGLTYMIHNEVLLITTPEEAVARLLTEVYDVTDLVSVRDDNGRFWHDHDSLIKTISATVTPTTWDDVGGPGSISGITFGNTATLVISQTEAVHEQVVALLARIRQVVKEQGKDADVPRRNPLPPPPILKGGMGVKG